MPSFVRNKIYRDLIGVLVNKLNEPGVGYTILEYLSRLAGELESNSSLAKSLDDFGLAILDDPKFEAFVGALIEQVASIVNSPEKEAALESKLEHLLLLLRDFAGASVDSPFFRIVQHISSICIRHFSEDLLNWIAQTISGWDSANYIGKN